MSEADAAARRQSEPGSTAAEVVDRRAMPPRLDPRDVLVGAGADDAVAEELAPLAASGWRFLHDRVTPTGEHISHLVVGPGAIIVLASKAWKGDVEIRNGMLYHSSWSQARVLNSLETQAQAVRAALGRDEVVDHALVIATQPDLPPGKVGAAAVLGLSSLRPSILETRTIYSPEQVERMRARLAAAFPPAGAANHPSSGLHSIDGIEVGELFARANRFFFLDHRSRSGQRRIHLVGEEGRPLGWRELSTGHVHLSHPDDVMAAAVLRAAASDGVHLDPRDLPKLPIDTRTGGQRGVFGRVHTTAIIGDLRHDKGRRLLHGTLANPAEGVFALGYVDVDTGWINPAGDGPLSPDRGPAARYLALLRDRFPLTTPLR